MLSLALPYVPDLFAYRRRPTRVVMVGDVGVGGDNPIRVQSMTTTLTKDIDATVAQTKRLVEVGCEIVRITTPTPNDARCLAPIKERLARAGIRVPIVADIHFSPQAALVAAQFADKVRVNPGNYTDSRKFAVREYSEHEYAADLARVEERFTPLVLACKERGIAMRIGTNHGSLSDRIMNRFGDTPEGMVESALEFVRICEKHDYFDIILSMKASNPKVMVAAYRLLAARMADESMDYPFHLGVTEAGNAEDGRIKSAIGIGSLLEDGIGDTIRVSLTEEPEAEIPVAHAIRRRYDWRPAEISSQESQNVPWDLFHFERRKSQETALGSCRLGGGNVPAVFTTIDDTKAPDSMARILRWASPAGKRQPKPEAAILTLRGGDDLDLLKKVAARLEKWPQAQLALVARSVDTTLLLDALPYADGIMCPSRNMGILLLAAAARDAHKTLILHEEIAHVSDRGPAMQELLDAARDARDTGNNVILSLTAPDSELIHSYRMLARDAASRNLEVPILLAVPGGADSLISPAILAGALLCDGIGDGLVVEHREDATALAFNILQAAGARIFKTDYVACPSCGRTLFDLQETTERIKQRTSHLVGVRLAIMGCIVNGPGEMADADFGYVGGAPGQVNLYVGKECVEKGVPAEIADDRLIELIKSRGKWQEETD